LSSVENKIVAKYRGNKKSVLITGATGFVGSNLLRRLLDINKYDIHVIIRQQSDIWRIKDILDKVNVHYGDLIDKEQLHNILKKAQPNIIYHLAAYGSYPSQKEVDVILQTNILGTWNLLQACEQVNYSLFVNTGTSAEYGSKGFATKETDILEPNNYYAVSKAAQTLLCQHIARLEKRPICTLRLFTVYGPADERTRLVPQVISRCLKGEDLLLSSPETARDFVYVEDVVEAYLRVDRLSKLGGEIFNVGSGVQHTINDIVSEVMNLTNSKAVAKWGALPVRTWDTSTWVSDIAKIGRLLDWEPKHSLRDGLLATIQWYKGLSN
jgi:nucleoside-diphosphate-sugar epimerase